MKRVLLEKECHAELAYQQNIALTDSKLPKIESLSYFVVMQIAITYLNLLQAIL
jgi:hypothetical protein